MARSCVVCGRVPDILIEMDKKFYCTNHAVIGGYAVEQNIMRMRKLPAFRGKKPEFPEKLKQ